METRVGYKGRMSNVYFVKADRSDSDKVLARKIEKIWESSGAGECFQKNDLTALKLHVGEPGTKTYVSPAVVAPLVRCIRSAGARPFLTDTSVLYKSPRDNAVSHAHVAYDHGFTMERTGAPFIPTDGLNGSDEIEIEVNGRHYQTVAIATAAVQARSMLVLTHATGHLGTGFGGTLKNIGMGCSSKKGKLRQHHGQHPDIDADRCTACGTCAEWCPVDAITVDAAAKIDTSICIGCGECVAVCMDGAVRFGWGIEGGDLQERMVEHAAAVVRGKEGRLVCVTVAMNITKDCDCLGIDQEPLCDDIGILVSTDPVAIDEALLRLFRERTGQTLESVSYPEHDGTIQIRYAEELGIGSSDVEIVTIS